VILVSTEIQDKTPFGINLPGCIAIFGDANESFFKEYPEL
jgi:hypothetical protein